MLKRDSGVKQNKGSKIKRREKAIPPVSVTPTDRLVAMTRERIDALESDKERLMNEVARLTPLASENARLEEALGNAESNGVAANVLIGVGGFLVSYSTFTGKLAEKVADAAAGCLLAGIVLLGWQASRRWRKG